MLSVYISTMVGELLEAELMGRSKLVLSVLDTGIFIKVHPEGKTVWEYAVRREEHGRVALEADSENGVGRST